MEDMNWIHPRTDWLETQDVEMQLVELKSVTLWSTKFAVLLKQLETTAVREHRACILACCICRRDVAVALLSVLVSTHVCEQIIAHVKLRAQPLPRSFNDGAL